MGSWYSPVSRTEAERHDLIPVTVRLIWDIDGVVDVVEKLGTPTPASQ